VSTAFPTRFSSVLDLARLPWFSVVDGQLRAAPEVGPIIDIHTHVAMTNFVKLKVDVFTETPDIKHYLPVDAAVDLEVYSNRNFAAKDLRRLKVDVSLLTLTGRGMRKTHTAPNLLRDMDLLGIKQAVLLPYDLSWGASNAAIALQIGAKFPRIIPFGSVHPKANDIEGKLAAQKSAGARGIKLHPNGQFIAPDHPKTVHLCGRCGEHGLPILFHCGPAGIEPKAAQDRSQVYRYEKVLAEFPNTTFILGHCGALQVDQAVRFADKYPNAWYDLSCLGLSGMKTVFDSVPHDRIMYGTDWPFYHQSLTLARVLIVTDENEQLRRSVLYDNAQRLLGMH
jgi:uncharacterized protein